MFNRKELSDKFYRNWKPINNIFEIKEETDDQFLIDFYKEYIEKLKDFINELDTIQPTINKIDFKKNCRQKGGYIRCVLDFPDCGWKEKHYQFEQGYKELMIDYLFYDDSLEYDDISLNEIQEMKKMGYFLICQAERNIYDLVKNKN